MSKVNRKYHFIYKTTNLINGNYYYGMHSTDDLDDGYLGSGHRLWKSIRKYGQKNHKREIIEFCNSREELILREKEIVNEELVKLNECMNICTGGHGGSRHNALARNKTLLNRLKTDTEYREKFRKAVSEGLLKYNKENLPIWLGKKHKEESKAKIGEKNSINQSGQKNSQYGTRWITNGIKNKKIKKEELVPNGWRIGRKIKFD